MTLRHLRARVNMDAIDRVTEEIFSTVESNDVVKLRALFNSVENQLERLTSYNENGCTCLGLACEKGHLDIVKDLIKLGAPVNNKDFYGQTPLHYAVERGHLDTIGLLIKAWADANYFDNLSAMHIAACKGQTEAAKLLIKAGCDVDAQDTNGVTVLHCAVANGHTAIVESLLEAGANVNVASTSTNRTPIFMAVEVKNEDLLKILLKYKAKLKHQDSYGMTPLCEACLHNSTNIASILISAGSKVNIPDNKQNYPIHYAARNGNVQIAEKLIHNGSELNALNINFSGPLHLAVGMGHLEMVKLLVDKGCDVNARDKYNRYVTALHVAVNSFSDAYIFTQLLQILIEGDCWLDSRAYSSLETPLFRAVDQGKTQLALALLQHGASPNVECPFDITVLQKACQKSQRSVIHTILQSNLDWREEAWLESDVYKSGINPKLLDGYERDIPMALYKNQELYYEILENKHNPLSLLRISRIWIRRYLMPKLHLKVSVLEIPTRLKDFLMLNYL